MRCRLAAGGRVWRQYVAELEAPPVRRELLPRRASMNLQPAESILEVGAARQGVLHTGRALDLVEAALREEYQAEAVHVAAGERQ